MDSSLLNMLPDDYVKYELLLRRVDISNLTMRTRKMQLLRIVEMERQSQSVQNLIPFLQPAPDLNECATLVALLNSGWDREIDNPEKIEAQLLCLSKRLERIETVDEALREQKNLLQDSIRELQNRLGNVSISVLIQSTRTSGDALPPSDPQRVNAAIDHTVQPQHRVRFNQDSELEPELSGQRQIPAGNLLHMSWAHFPIHSTPGHNPRMGITDFQTNDAPRTQMPHNFSQAQMPQDFSRAQQTTSGGNPNYYLNQTHPGQFYWQKRPDPQISKWGIKFTGDDKSSASDFILRVRDFATSRRVTEGEILTSLAELLDGTALKWLRTRQEPFNSYSDFVQSFLADFQPFYLNDSRIDVIKKRLQQPGEKIVNYITFMRNEFLTLAQIPTEAAQLKIIKKNLLPKYIAALALHQFTSLDELKTAGLRIEHSDSLIREQNRYNFNYSQSSQQGQYRQHTNSNYRSPNSVETQSQIPNRFGPAAAPAHSFNSQRLKGAPQIPNGPPPPRNYGYQQSTSVGSGIPGQNPFRQTQFSTPKTPTNSDTRNFQVNRVYPATSNVKINALNTDDLDKNTPDEGDVSFSTDSSPTVDLSQFFHHASILELESDAETPTVDVLQNESSAEHQDDVESDQALNHAIATVHSGGSDNRPHAIIKLYGVIKSCLLDSGASNSIAGCKGIQILQSLSVPMTESPKSCVSTADKTRHPTQGIFETMVEFKDSIKMIKFVAVPSLDCEFILGIDFWSRFSISLSAKEGQWFCNNMNVINHSGLIDFKELSMQQQDEAEATVGLFKSLNHSSKLGRTGLITHQIDTGEALPTCQRHYPVSKAIESRMHNELQRMIDLDVIEPSASPWRSPAILVPKANGKDRLCIDSRKVNAVTKFDSYPLPHISSILDRLGEANYLTSIDLNDAFWQIPLSEDSKEKTAFAIPGKGLWQMKVVGFGFRNSPQCLQRLMDQLFGDILFPYLDDIVIASKTFEEHIQTLTLVYEKLSWANLTINFDKCQFFRSSLKYLGFIVDSNGLHTDPGKVSAIANYPTPKTIKDVRRFMGLASWYRRFVQNFATIASPIFDTIRGLTKGKKFIWTAEATTAFNTLKEELVKRPMLTVPDFTKSFTIHVDASSVGLGAVLTQGSDESPIAFASRKFRGNEAKFSATERECLAALFGIEQFRQYVEGTKFTLITDHSALTWLLKSEKLPNDRLARWVLRFAPYSFTAMHRKGAANIVPDALSRDLPTFDNDDDKDLPALAELVNESFTYPEQLSDSTDMLTISLATISLISEEHSPSDKWYNDMVNRVKSEPSNFKNFVWKNGLLLLERKKKPHEDEGYDYQMVVPESKRQDALVECHNAPTAGHMGIKKTKSRLAQRYFWPGMAGDVEKYVKNCSVCRESKSQNTPKQGLMGKYKSATRPMQMIAIDIVGPLTRSSKQNTCLLVATDWFTKFPFIFPLRAATATKICTLLEEQIFLIYGVPEIVVLDNGKQFVSKQMKALFAKYAIAKVWYNSYYHPQNNFTERTNKTIGNCLRAYVGVNHKKWDAQIPEITLALRTAVNEVTGYTPFFLMFGRECSLAASDYKLYDIEQDIETALRNRSRFLVDFQNVFNEVSFRIKRAYDKNKARYDRGRRDVEYEVGDVVYKKNHPMSNAIKSISSKLLPKNSQFTIVNKRSKLSYDLVDAKGKPAGNYHINDLFK